MVNRIIQEFCLLILVFLAGTAFGKRTPDTPFALEGIEVTSEKISEYIKNHPPEVTVVVRKEIVDNPQARRPAWISSQHRLREQDR